MLILINDNNIFINGFERNVFNYGVIMGIIEHILIKDYCIPAMHVGGQLRTETVVPIPCGHLFSINGLMKLVITAEINKILYILQQNASLSNLIYITIYHGRIALTNQCNGSKHNDTGNVCPTAI